MSDICVSHPWTVERAYSRSKSHGTFPSHMCTSHVDTGEFRHGFDLNCKLPCKTRNLSVVVGSVGSENPSKILVR